MFVLNNENCNVPIAYNHCSIKILWFVANEARLIVKTSKDAAKRWRSSSETLHSVTCWHLSVLKDNVI